MDPPPLEHHPSSSTSDSTIKALQISESPRNSTPTQQNAQSSSSPSDPALTSSPAQSPEPHLPSDTPSLRPHHSLPPSSSHSSPGPHRARLAPPPHSHSTGDSRSSSVTRRGRPVGSVLSASSQTPTQRTAQLRDGYESDNEREGPEHRVRTLSTSSSRSPGRKWPVPDEAHPSPRTAAAIIDSDEEDNDRDIERSWFWGHRRKRTSSLKPEQVEALTITRQHVSKAILAVLTPEARKKLTTLAAAHSTLKAKEKAKEVFSTTLDVAHEVLTIAVDTLDFVPVPGLSAGARLVLRMWDSCGKVDMNSMASFRLTQRAADILLSVREEVESAGDKVTAELQQPLSRLVEAFTQVNNFLLKQSRRPFLKRYLKRDEIATQIQDCDKVLSDVINVLGISIQIRLLRQMQEAEEARKHDTDKLLDAISHISQQQGPLLLSSPQATGPLLLTVSPGATPRVSSPLSNVYGSTPSDLDLLDFQQEQVKNLSPPTVPSKLPDSNPDIQFPQGPDYHPYGLLWETEFPLPPHQTPRASPQPPLIGDDSLSPHTVIRRIQSRQNAVDAQMDHENLRSRLLTTLGGSGGDAEIVDALQVRRDEMPEAIKALQRTLERISEDESPMATLPPLRRKSTLARRRSTTGSRAADALIKLGMDRDSTESTISGLSVSDSSSRRSWGDSLDREFIETGIDALKRISQSAGVQVGCPSWTITRYEIDRLAQIGIGSFSKVYRGKYGSQTVAVKVLSPTTPHALFVKEVSIWNSLSHRNVLELIGASSATSDPPWYLISPFMKNGSLSQYLHNNKATLGEPILIKMMHQIAKGMSYLHSERVLHGDLKAANVLVADDLHCVISDFGQSEMKSEVYRLSGTKRPHGTLQWQAPELLDGTNGLTTEIDVFAFAMCCIEILTYGGLPWSRLDDDVVLAYVTKENRRPPIPSQNAALRKLIERCWDQSPLERPSFQEIAGELKQIRLAAGHKDTEEPSLPAVIPPLPEPLSPDPTHIPLQPEEVPAPETDLSLSGAVGSETQDPPAPKRRSKSLFGPRVDILHGEPTAPVVQKHNPLPYTSANSSQHSLVSVDTSTTPTTATSTTDEEENSAQHSQRSREDPNPLSLSPETMTLAKNERRYRILLRHNFNATLKLALWHPVPVSLGAVGYLSKPAGKFVTLFNAFNPSETSQGRADGMGSLHGYPNVTTSSHRDDKYNAAQRGFNAFIGMLPFRSRAPNSPNHVSRRHSYELRARHRAAYLCTESTMYHCIENLDGPKKWFRANVDTIMELYSAEYHLAKEDFYLVTATLDAPDHAQFVSHRHPDGHANFNVYSSPRPGEAWGYFNTDALTPDGRVVPPQEEPTIEPQSASRVSSAGGPWETVLIGRLRFKPDASEPTSK